LQLSELFFIFFVARLRLYKCKGYAKTINS
jgi:hypothetical protein